MNNNNTLNNVEQSNMETNQSSMTEQKEQITVEESQYDYLKELNKRLSLFKNNDQFEKKEDETGQTMRR